MMGGERENIILLACLSMVICSTGRDFFSICIAIVVWIVGFLVSKMAAKADPWGTKVFLKSLQYQDFYPAREKTNTPKCVIKRKREF